VKLATSTKAGVRALLAKHGIRLAVTDLNSDAATEQLAALSLPGTYAIRLAAQRRLMLMLAEEIAATEHELARRLRHHPGYCKLLQLKGVGPVLAAIFIAEIGDVSRFATAQALCCWSGITPRHHESDRTVRRGHISKEGCKLIRWAAVESIQRDCEPAVKKVKDDIIARRGPGARNVAKVAAGRRMLEAVYYTLRDGEVRFLTQQPVAA
jgi:transposase